MKETELWELLVSLSANEISLAETHDRILCLFGVSGRFYTDKEIEKIKYLSFLQGTVDGDTGEE